MTLSSVADLLDAVARSQLLEPGQLHEARGEAARFTDPRLLARELVQRGWLTPYQANQIVLGRAAGLRLGAYVLLDKLGEGGMGAVYKAHHQKLGRVVAVKVIRKERLSHPDAVRRFQREIQAAARLVHPSVILAYDADEADDRHFFVMEYVEGTDLARLVRRQGPLPVGLACDCVRQAALALQHAHEHGLVHRDVKPSNLLLTAGPSPVVKVLDLGLARLQAAASEESTTLTQEGAVMGTPDYIAPEQARDSHTVDIRADLYSLGGTLYYLLTGRVPFPGGTLTEKLLKHQFDEPAPVERLRPDVPPEVAGVVRRLMAKRPEERYQTPAELAMALAAVGSRTAHPVAVPAAVAEPVEAAAAPAAAPFEALEPTLAEGGHGSTADLPDPARRRRLILGAAGGGVLVAVLAGTLILLLRPSGGPAGGSDQGPPSEPGARAALAQLLAREKDAGADRARLRQDVVAFREQHPGSEQAARAAELLCRLPSPLDALSAASIPAEDRLDGQPAELVALLGDHRGWDGTGIWTAAWSPDGRQLATGGPDGVRLWDAATLRPRALLPKARGALTVLFTPDGRSLITSGFTVRVWDVTGPEPRKTLTVEDPAGRCGPCAYHAAAKLLAMTCADRAVRLWDLSGPVPKLRGVLKGHTEQPNRPAFSPDGKTLATTSHDHTVRLWDLTADPPKEKAVLRGHGDWTESAAFSPDGWTLATTGAHDWTVRLWDLHASPPREKAVMPIGTAATVVTFAPDGRTLAAGTWQGTVVFWDVTGASPVQRPALRCHTGLVDGVAYSPDGSRLATGAEHGGIRLWDLTTSPPKDLFPRAGHTGPVNAVAFAPDDGALISAGDDETVRVWDVAAARPAERSRLTGQKGVVTSLQFHPEGRLLAAGANEGALTLWDEAAGKVTAAWQAHGRAVRGLSFNPSGRLLATAANEKEAAVWLPTTGERWRAYESGSSAVHAVAFSPGGRALAVAEEGGGVVLWDPVEGRTVLSLPAHSAPAVAVAFSPDGKRLAAGYGDGAVKLWDAVTGQLRSARTEHTKPVTGLAFSPDGKVLASAAEDGQLIVWDAESGDRRLLWGLHGILRGPAFAGDGRHLAVGHANGNVYIFRLPHDH
jgi:WD40 repeat protein/tRNA A-37 threonylcarbamoyl transferase component Bud32